MKSESNEIPFAPKPLSPDSKPLEIIELDQRLEFSAFFFQDRSNNNSCNNIDSCVAGNNSGSCTNVSGCVN